jgi:hypothetical protein
MPKRSSRKSRAAASVDDEEDSGESFFAETTVSDDAIGEKDQIKELRDLARKETYNAEMWRRIVLLVVSRAEWLRLSVNACDCIVCSLSHLCVSFSCLQHW